SDQQRRLLFRPAVGPDERPREASHQGRTKSTPIFGGIRMLLDHIKFVVKSQSKKFSSKKAFEIVDGETGQTLGAAKDTTGFFASLFGSANLEVRDVSNNALLFSVRRTGWFLNYDTIVEPEGSADGGYRD